MPLRLRIGKDVHYIFLVKYSHKNNINILRLLLQTFHSTIALKSNKHLNTKIIGRQKKFNHQFVAI